MGHQHSAQLSEIQWQVGQRLAQHFKHEWGSVDLESVASLGTPITAGAIKEATAAWIGDRADYAEDMFPYVDEINGLRVIQGSNEDTRVQWHVHSDGGVVLMIAEPNDYTPRIYIVLDGPMMEIPRPDFCACYRRVEEEMGLPFSLPLWRGYDIHRVKGHELYRYRGYTDHHMQQAAEALLALVATPANYERLAEETATYALTEAGVFHRCLFELQRTDDYVPATYWQSAIALERREDRREELKGKLADLGFEVVNGYDNWRGCPVLWVRHEAPNGGLKFHTPFYLEADGEVLVVPAVDLDNTAFNGD